MDNEHKPNEITDSVLNNINDPLQRIRMRLSLIGDRVRQVIDREDKGMYLMGRGGTGKTTKVLEILKDEGINYDHYLGKITPAGLREYLGECVDRGIEVVVFDDVSAIFDNKDVVQTLLAALDGRPISYRRQGQQTKTIHCDFGIIFISNEDLPNKESLKAFKTRVRFCDYSPSDDEIAALMRNWAANGPLPHGMTRAEVIEVIEFLITESFRINAPLDLRLIKKSCADYRSWKQDRAENHWHVLIISEIEHSIIAGVSKAPKKFKSRADRLNDERDIVRQILKETEIDDRATQLKLWRERSGGLDDHRFDRRKREVRNDL